MKLILFFSLAFILLTSTVLAQSNLITLVNFIGANGANPYASLTLAKDGNFYGTTQSGGTLGYGTVFKLSTNGNLSTVVNFNNVNGAAPFSPLTIGNDEILYGTTFQGGSIGYGTVFEATTNGALTVLANFAHTNKGGSLPTAGLTLAMDGVLYGTTQGGGMTNGGTVFKVTTNGTLTILINFTNSVTNATGAGPYSGLTIGSDGNFYGTTVNGGINGGGTVFKLASDGSLTSLISFTNAANGNATNANGANPYAGIIFGNDGSLYGVTANGGTSAGGTVFSATTNGLLRTLVNFNGTNGNYPIGGLIKGNDGYFYGTTQGGGLNGLGTVFKMDTNGTLTTLSSFAYTNGAFPKAGLAVGNDGNFYGTTMVGGISNLGTIFELVLPHSTISTNTIFVSNSGNSTIEKVDLATGADLGVLTTNGLNQPTGLIFDSAGNLYMANLAANISHIEKITPDGTSSLFFDTTNHGPIGLAVDATDNLYVAYSHDNVVEKFSPDGTDLGPFASTAAYPFGLTFDSYGNLFVACANGNMVEKFSPSGSFVGYFVSPSPAGLAFDSSGNLYVANGQSKSIKKYAPDGTALGTFASTGAYGPNGLVFDNAGNLYAALPDANKIEKFSAAGTDLGPFATNGLSTPIFMVLGSSVKTVLLTNLIVFPSSAAIAAGSNLQFTVTEYFSDGSSQVVTNGGTNSLWSSSNLAVAYISTNGLAVGITNGSTTITASYGSVIGSTTLTVAAPPAISIQPTNNIVPPNGTVTLTVSATGGGLNYQWQLNGTNISGANGTSLTITSVDSTNIGVYTVIVSNLASSTTSQAAIVGTTAISMFAGVIVNGPVGTNYVIQSTGNLNDGWTTRTNLALPSQPYIYIDYNSPTNPQQFYRAGPQ